MKVTYQLSNMTGGELSPRLDGRVDITKHKNGLRALLNATVLPHGGARKRSGSKYVVQQPSTDDVRFVPFIYNTEQAYMLVFGPAYVWFMKDQGIITFSAQNVTGITKANPAVVTCNGHGYSNGNRVILTGVSGMTEVNNRVFIVANATANTFELNGINSTSYGTYTSGGSVARLVEIATTYTEDELPELQFAQSNDTLYICHGNHPIRTLSRTSHTGWTLATPSITTGPFRTINADRANTITPSIPTATITGATQANPCVLTVTGHYLTVGQQVRISGVVGMTELNYSGSNVYTVTAATATTLTLNVDSTGFTAYASGGLAFKSATLYGTHEVGTVCFLTATSATFDADMVGGLYRLYEDGAGTGVMGAAIGNGTALLTVGNMYTNAGKVYGIADKDVGAGTWAATNRVPDHDAGTVRVYGTGGAWFDSAFLHPLYCIVRITAYISATVLQAEIIRFHMPKNVVDLGTTYWAEGAWSVHRGYPKSIAWYEQRLFFGGSDSEPTALWGSKSGAYLDFTDGADDDDAIVYRIASGRADVIRWLQAGRVLTCGTSSGEFAVAASNQNEALTPSNFKVTPQTSYGTSDALPYRINQAVLYPQRGGRASNASRKLREFQYAFSEDAFNSVDLSVFAEHIFGDGFDRITYQLEPDSTIVCRRTDGLLASCTYERSQEVVAWHRQQMGGTNAKVMEIDVIPGANGDEIWLSVERTISGATTRYIEVLQPAFRDDDEKADAFFVDGGLTYSGSSTSTITGLWHLRGETVVILNNGNVETGTVSATGALTLQRATTKAHIGLPYTMVLETEEFEAGAQAGTAQSRAKRISQIHVRLLNSLGGTFGPDAQNLQTIYYRTGADIHGSSPPLFTGLQHLDFPSGWDREARVRIEHSDPLPMHITGITAEQSVTG